MKDLAIRIEGLTKKYNCYPTPLDRLKETIHPFRKKYHQDFYALKNINFEVQKGETIGVIGKNGSGKSTLLKIITNVLTPTEGRVVVDGRILALLELGTGFNPELTGIENIFFNAAIMGYSKEQVNEKIDAIIEFADIGDFVNQPVKIFSSGMYVRLAFAIIANMAADILIVDEALAVGDAFFSQKCMRFLRKFREKGTVFFVSHDIGSVVNLCHHALWLEKGSLKMVGTAKQVCESYLADFYEENRLAIGRSDDGMPEREEGRPPHDEVVDQRLKFINHTQYRNDIQLFDFDKSRPSFGKRVGSIVDVKLLDRDNRQLTWVVGGEPVKLAVRVRADDEISSVIVGFFVKDRLGQTLFGDNTCLTYCARPFKLGPGEYGDALFEFNMPVFPSGSYSICVSLAEGTQEEHVQHHWIHDALFFESHSSSVCTGLIGVPMSNIVFKK